MNDSSINDAVNNYVRDHLSPKPEQREYISEKYNELKLFLGGVCFRTGSYARYTAIDPVHDLDVIYPVTNVAVRDNPTILVNQLLAQLKEQYKASSTKIKQIYAQTHSVTIELADSPGGDFSIDAVPAIALTEKNNDGHSLFLVREFQRLNHRNRQQRYERSAERPIGWIKSDPRGYIKAASDLNDANGDFRHATKLIKGWRHACKMAYQDDFKLKSFHLERIVSLYFESNQDSSTVEAIVACLVGLPDYLDQAQIPDRADSGRLIDEYVNEISVPERNLILRLQGGALAIAKQLPLCSSDEEVSSNITALTTVVKPRTGTPATRSVTPRQPWAC